LLVELKGKNFGQALEQIEATLQLLCKRSGRNIIHAQTNVNLLEHDPPTRGGVCAYVVLSKGRGVPKRQAERRKLQQRYGVIVYPHSQELRIDGLEKLPG
jgi:hypothetical protein